MKRILRNQQVRLFELLSERSAVLEDITFEDCKITGPAIVFSKQSDFSECTFTIRKGDYESILWEIPADKPKVSGVIVLRRCSFLRCHFEGIGFAGFKDWLERFKAAFVD